MSIIKKLKDEGALVLYHDYRSRSAIDHSGNGNGGTLSNTCWRSQSVCFPSTDSAVRVNDSAELQLTTGALVILGNFTKQTKTTRLISKRDAGGTNYQLSLITSGLRLSDGVANRDISFSVSNNTLIGVNFADTETAEAFIDGPSIGNFVGTSSITVDDAQLDIGNDYNDNENSENPFSAALICNRKLTAQEHSDLYDELDSKVWPTMPWTRVQPLQGVSADLWKTHWGVNESVSPTTSGFIENSPFRVDSGSFQIGTDTIGGKNVKVIECVSAGVIYVPTSYFHQTTGEAAYGEWVFWLNKSNGSSLIPQLFSDAVGLAGATNNNNIFYRNDETIALRRAGVTLVDSSPVSFVHSTWHKICVTRNVGNLFDLFVNDTSIGTAVDATHITGDYMLCDMDPNDMVAYSNIAGGHAIVKKKA
jgi:hypothetical protein